MFSAVPVPQPVWNEKNMRYALCAFPLVGVVCGVAWFGWSALAEKLAFPLIFRAAGFCLLPVWLT
ncbi:MAG: adenosylcobinamide-GDP ribazoletransferase, partial [Anaerotignum sp.]|nr:adenosylcobinamide-GDP ribazoletransferase [Anaerotignum sp.]